MKKENVLDKLTPVDTWSTTNFSSGAYDGKKIILSGNKGNLGPIWENILTDQGADVYGFDYDDKKENSINNADVRKLKSLTDFRTFFREAGGGVPDIIINNAAIDTPPTKNNINFFTDYNNVIDTNLIGAINLVSLFIDDMKQARKGLIINIGSIQGNVAADIRNYDAGFEKPVGYNVSKAGLIQYTRSLAVQYGAYGIRAVCLAFSAVDSGKFEEPFKSKFLNCLPLKKLISEKSLAAALRFAIDCPELTGQQVLIDAGYTAW
jgi:NAD(P)-dependent dehydrogenase (short-subunit alcohol dehydrogenase family)